MPTNVPGLIMAKDITTDSAAEGQDSIWRQRMRNLWKCSVPTLLTTLLGSVALFLMTQSFLTRQVDTKGCEMAYMWPNYFKYDGFDTEHTRFASKYSLYLYREGGMNDDFTVKGVPVLFIPGNAGSYKQARSIASEAAYHYHNTVRNEATANGAVKRPLDVFSVDFNEDFTAFHGQTLLDQAEYLNDAIRYILSLYHTPGHFDRDPNLPDPTSVIIVGHSMGGVAARTMITMPNYQANSINTIITLAAPHARPPVSFDGDIVRIYKGVNDYWRHAHSQKWAIDNPLSHVTLISIAGGGLDTIVSSDYASIDSLIPETHGFTVFTSSMPNVWTGMDHLAITWCDQNRKSVVRAIYDVIDASTATQTISRAQRMRGFKKWFLTGLEDIAEKALPHTEATTLLTIDADNSMIPQGETFVLRNLGMFSQRPKVHLIAVPPQDAHASKFALLTNEKLDSPGEHGVLEVLFCSPFPSQPGQSTALFSMDMDLSGNSSSATRLACKNAASDGIALPASTVESTFPFQTDQQPFTYLQYGPEHFAGYQFVAVVDKAGDPRNVWVIAEFSNSLDTEIKVDMSLLHVLATKLSLRLPARRSLATHIHIPALHSSLLAYNVHFGERSCHTRALFTPLLRQYVTNVYESKYFVNVKDASVNLHGVSPYMPPSLCAKQPSNGLSLQIWMDPSCNTSMEVTLTVDVLGSLGKLWMRYRIVFAAFPLLIVALVLRQQFRTYDRKGVFISFAQSLNKCLSTSIPLALTALTILSITIAGARHKSAQHRGFHEASSNVTSAFADTDHELLLGSDDTFFWFLVPLFGTMCIGICVAVNYVALLLEFIFAFLYASITSAARQSDGTRKAPSGFAATSNQQRIVTTLILLSMVSTVIPYHFAYVILCLVHLATCVRAFHFASSTRLDSHYNFYNYAHSILILMLWILPINLPVLVVWVRNLAIRWLTPFSAHHNILSILPFVFLVETLSSGRMVPQMQASLSLFTNVFLASIGAYAAMYGVTYAYVLHHLANVLCAWLVAIHYDVASLSARHVGSLLGDRDLDSEMKKRP